MTPASHATGPRCAAGIRVELGGDVARVRSEAARAAVNQGFPPRGIQVVEQVAAEMAAHLVVVQGEGRVLVRPLDCGERHGVELILSTTSTRSFGADDLLADLSPPHRCETYAAAGRGTVMAAELWADPLSGANDRRFLVGSMADPIAGESISGDAWASEQRGARIVTLVADGLGHGEKAAAASRAAVDTFRDHHLEPVEQLAARIHAALRSTRGGAIALAEVDSDLGQLRFCGIGNVTARLLLGDGAHELISRYGIAGYQDPQILVSTKRWTEHAMLIMHTDGVSSRWNVGSYPDLHLQHPQLAATTVMRDAPRANDDALVVAVRSVHDTSATTRSEPS